MRFWQMFSVRSLEIRLSKQVTVNELTVITVWMSQRQSHTVSSWTPGCSCWSRRTCCTYSHKNATTVSTLASKKSKL